MATIIDAGGGKVKIDRVFLSGKDRIAINGQVMFTGKLHPGKSETATFDGKEYVIVASKVGALTDAMSYRVQVNGEGTTFFSGHFDQHGRHIEDEGEARQKARTNVCAQVGCGIGMGTLFLTNPMTGLIGGGSVLENTLRGGFFGGIAWVVGGAIGWAIGATIFEKK